VAKLAAFKEELQPLVPHISAAIRAGLSSAENAPSALQCLEAWGALGLTLDQLDGEGLLEPLVIGVLLRPARYGICAYQYRCARVPCVGPMQQD
jgi:hypothetical protein